MTTPYQKGAQKEYKICRDLKAAGWDIVQRSAGSHSPIDILAVNKDKKEILFVQSKRKLSAHMDYIEHKEEERLMKEFGWASGEFKVRFEAR